MLACRDGNEGARFSPGWVAFLEIGGLYFLYSEQLGFFYRARVSMAKHAIQAGEKLVNLSPGMNVTVEIKTGKRRVIGYFLTPVLRGFDESVRER